MASQNVSVDLCSNSLMGIGPLVIPIPEAGAKPLDYRRAAAAMSALTPKADILLYIIEFRLCPR